MNLSDVDPIAIVLLVTHSLDELGVPYFVGGSMASALHGSYRATADADIVANLGLGDVNALVGMLEGEFFLDDLSLSEAVRDRRSFNILHKHTLFKVDVFVTKGVPFDRSQLDRRVREVVIEATGETIDFASAEDTVLSKLVWYRAGGEVSERQWRDVLEVIRAVGDKLDGAYIGRWAKQLGVSDLWLEAETAAHI